MTTQQSDSVSRWPPTFRAGIWPAVGFVLAFTIWVLISTTFFTWLFGENASLIHEGLWSIPSGLIQSGIAVAVLRYEGATFSGLGLSRRLLRPAIIATAGAIVAVNGAVVGLAILVDNHLSFGLFALYRAPPNNLSMLGVVVTALSAYVFIGPVEELAFRGYLQNKLVSVMECGSLRLRTAISIVATGVIFSVLHIPVRLFVDGIPASQLTGTLILLSLSGMIFGMIYALTQNLYLVMFLHGVGDFWPLVVDPGRGVWPNYLVLLLIYAVLIVGYRQLAAQTDIPTPTLSPSP